VVLGAPGQATIAKQLEQARRHAPEYFAGESGFETVDYGNLSP
jgi:hypothetical protein